MPKIRNLKPNTVLDKNALTQFFKENDIKSVHLSKIWRTFIKNPLSNFNDIINLPKRACNLLSNNFVGLTSSLVSSSISNDKKTVKLLIKLQDGLLIESVIIKHYDNRSGGHNVLCVSSQVGCKMGCKFCSTGTMGLKGNLTNGEILEQIVHAKCVLKDSNDNNINCDIRNIVFMGMGEPLDNYDEVSKALHGMFDRSMFSLGWSHITVSTVGVINRMKEFSNEFPKCNLALSLHASNQIIRKNIVPTSNQFTIKKLIDSLEYHIRITGNKVFIEYISIGNVNMDSNHAIELCNLFKNNNIPLNKIIINLIPYNPTEIGDKYSYKSPTNNQMFTFKNIIIKNGIFCTIRNSTTSGQDIDGACGQLSLKYKQNNTNDIEDIIQNVINKPKKRNSIKKSRKKLIKKRKNKNVNKIIKLSISFGIMVIIMTILFQIIGINWNDIIQI